MPRISWTVQWPSLSKNVRGYAGGVSSADTVPLAGQWRELEMRLSARCWWRSRTTCSRRFPDSIRGDAAAEDTFTVPPHHTLAEIERMAVVQTLQRTNGTSRRRADP